MVKIFIAVLVGTVAMIVIFTAIDASTRSNAEEIAYIVNSDNVTSISVSISGEITRAGTYLMDAKSDLGDLISTASGVTSNADELAYDTSYELKDGLSFYIAPKYDNNDVCSLEMIEKVNINKDDSETLQSVNGIGYTVANSIVTYRENNGNFYRIEDLKNVSGIGNATFEKIKNYVRLRD